MAVKTIQIADKPTLDATKALLEDSEVGLAAIKQAASSGAVSGSAGGLQIEKYVDEQVNGCVSVSTLPYYFHEGSAVVLNGEVHILGRSGSSCYTKHYKFNGTSWESAPTLPYNFYSGSAVVYNDEIHILGDGYSSNYTSHYKFNGTSWESVSTLPYSFSNGSAVVYNDEIHILGGGDSSDYTKHYLVRFDNRHIATMLPKGGHILLSDNEDIVYASNAKRISSNIAEVTDKGYVELLAALTDADNIKGYLTFY